MVTSACRNTVLSCRFPGQGFPCHHYRVGYVANHSGRNSTQDAPEALYLTYPLSSRAQDMQAPSTDWGQKPSELDETMDLLAHHLFFPRRGLPVPHDHSQNALAASSIPSLCSVSMQVCFGCTYTKIGRIQRLA